MALRKLDRSYRVLFFKDKPLSIQLFFLSALLVIIPMLVVGLISYHWSSNVIETQALGYNLEVLNQVKSHMEYYMRSFIGSAIKILNSPDMISFLRQVSDGQTVDSATAQGVLREMMFLAPEISNIYLSLDHRGSIQAVDRYDYPLTDFSQEYWFPLMSNREEHSILVTRIVHMQGRPEPVLSLIRRVISPQTLEPMGLLIIDINFRRLQEIAQNFNVSDRSFFIIDTDGRYVYHPDKSMVGKPIKSGLLDVIRSAMPETLLNIDEEQQYIIVSNSGHLDWTFLVTIPYGEVKNEVLSIGKGISLTVIVTLIIAYLLGLAYSTTIIQPVRNLQKLMREVETGHLKGEVDVCSRDEIGQLSRGFNKMVIRLAGLVEEVYLSRVRETEAKLGQKELEIKVMQAQVNPHFIGNSLETIRGMAMEKGARDIATMAGTLGLLLRYNLRQGTNVVKLHEEVTHLETYFKIQHYRFGDMVTHLINMPEWALNQQVVKFCLQPLVENCFLHGIDRKSKRMTIFITAERENENSFLIHITDTGNGIPKEKLKHIHEVLHTNVVSYSEHIGLVNVHSRIKYVFGNEFGIQISSLPGEGTKVSLRLPLTNLEGEIS
ncbi:MAG: histidine kinase [Anaerosporomusa subterranea]|nr:histidine kinase [Anaerosporomusa subterranea]